jgi:hypothetical protein
MKYRFICKTRNGANTFDVAHNLSGDDNARGVARSLMKYDNEVHGVEIHRYAGYTSTRDGSHDNYIPWLSVPRFALLVQEGRLVRT